MRVLPIAALLVALPTTAFALEQKDHKHISQQACLDRSLPEEFCERVGIESYNVDKYEWSAPEAHGQMANDDEHACTGANRILERQRTLAIEIRNQLHNLKNDPDNADIGAEYLATTLGRTLHTIQDLCAHHGLPNNQHAWYSLSDTCHDTESSPDLADDAFHCAHYETGLFFQAFIDEMYEAEVEWDWLTGVDPDDDHFPGVGDLCEYLKEADTWDGIDRRWNNAVVVPWVRDQMASGVRESDDRLLADACAEGIDITNATPWETVDTTTKLEWCVKADAVCIAKADGTEDMAPPWAHGGDEPQGAGCSVVPGSAGNSLAWLIAGLGVLLTVRRRRR
jgi:MYXO-CTERM domain-containing protein